MLERGLVYGAGLHLSTDDDRRIKSPIAVVQSSPLKKPSGGYARSCEPRLNRQWLIIEAQVDEAQYFVASLLPDVVA